MAVDYTDVDKFPAMTTLPLACEVVLVALVVAAAFFDLRTRRIPNFLVLAGFISGLALNTFLFGISGLWHSVVSFLLAFGVDLILYLLHARGAGDVKLMGAVGAIVASPWNWFGIFVFSAFAGGIVALIMALAKRRVRQTLWNVAFIFREMACLRAPYVTRKELDVSNPKALRLPHGAMIAFGSIVFVIFSRAGGWS